MPEQPRWRLLLSVDFLLRVFLTYTTRQTLRNNIKRRRYHCKAKQTQTRRKIKLVRVPALVARQVRWALAPSAMLSGCGLRLASPCRNREQARSTNQWTLVRRPTRLGCTQSCSPWPTFLGTSGHPARHQAVLSAAAAQTRRSSRRPRGLPALPPPQTRCPYAFTRSALLA